MALRTAPSRNPAGHAGLIDNALGIISALWEVIETRAALFGRESKTALLQLLIIAGCAVVALVCCVLGYLFIVASAIFAIAHATGVSWTWIALFAGVAHFLFAIVLLFVAKMKTSAKLFTETRAELKKDQSWLRTLSSEK